MNKAIRHAALAVSILLLFMLGYLLSPQLCTALLITFWLAGIAFALPRSHGQRLGCGLAITLTLIALYLWLGLDLSSPDYRLTFPASPVRALAEDAPRIDRFLAAGQKEILYFTATVAQLLWPSPTVFGFSLLFVWILVITWPVVQRGLLRRAANSHFLRLAWFFKELPRRLSGWIFAASVRGLFWGLFWALGCWLLGFKYPMNAGLVMALASITPFWGLPVAACLTLFFAADARHLFFQTGGAIIVFAVVWLACHLLLDSRLAAARPPIHKGLILLCFLGGYIIAGAGGSLAAVPLLITALHIEASLNPPRSRPS